MKKLKVEDHNEMLSRFDDELIFLNIDLNKAVNKEEYKRAAAIKKKIDSFIIEAADQLAVKYVLTHEKHKVKDVPTFAGVFLKFLIKRNNEVFEQVKKELK